LLEAGVRCLGHTERDTSPAAVESEATRLLAGEIAVRRYLGMSEEVISLDRYVDDPRQDSMRVYASAITYGGARWFQWIEERHSVAQALVSRGWDAIASGADHLEKWLPTNRNSRTFLPGFLLLDHFDRLLPWPDENPPTEILHADVLGGKRVRICRWWRVSVRRSLTIRRDTAAA
jgi:hypothetical protein